MFKNEFHSIDLRNTTEIQQLARKLFGLGSNPCGIMSKLHNTGVLHLQNIENLDLQLQHRLAQYLKSGFFTPVDSELVQHSRVRIICSTQDNNLQALVLQGKFVRSLYDELCSNRLSLPSPSSLSEADYTELVCGFVTEKGIDAENATELLKKRASSIQKLQEQVTQLCLKHKRNHSPADNPLLSTQLLADFADRGKNVLADKEAMNRLWTAFSKNQSQIAAFLGVSRAAVCKRCKEFDLHK